MMTMTILYKLHLSRPVANFVSGPVGTVPAKGLLFDLDGSDHVVPDREAIGHCLPANYRKAWARCKALSKCSGESGFHYTLYDARGRYLNTLYAIPPRKA